MAHRLSIDDLQKILADAKFAGVPGDSPIKFKTDGGCAEESPLCENVRVSFDLLAPTRELVIQL